MNGDGETRRRWHRRPAMIPLATVIALVATLMGVAYGYGQITDRTVQNAERIDRIEERIEKQLVAISNKLDQLFQPRVGSGPATNRHQQ